MKKDDERLLEFDGLRGLMAFWVLLGHCMIYSGMDKLPGALQTLRAPWMAVVVFMILSGFVIARLLYLKREKYKVFVVRRFLRLYPAYFVATIICILTYGLFKENLLHLPLTGIVSKSLYVMEITSQNPLPYLAAIFSLLQGVLPNSWLHHADTAYNTVAWSLSIEWQFYLVAPLLYLLTMKYAFGRYLLLIMAAFFFYFSATVEGLFSIAFLPVYFIYFFVGGISFVIYQRRERFKGLTTILMVVFITLILVLIARPDNLWVGIHLPLLLWFVVFITVIFRGKGEGYWPGKFISGVLNSRVCQFMGKCSYSTYLLHIPVLVVCQWFIWRYIPLRSQMTFFVLTTLSVVLFTYLVSYFSYRFIEEPFMAFGNRLAKKMS